MARFASDDYTTDTVDDTVTDSDAVILGSSHDALGLQDPFSDHMTRPMSSDDEYDHRRAKPATSSAAFHYIRDNTGIVGGRVKGQVVIGSKVTKNYNSPNQQRRESLLKNLKLTDPRLDKTRIEYEKGGLLEGAYHWILEHEDFIRWRDDPKIRLLRVKGDPGRGKTMLLCGVIDHLKKDLPNTAALSYFFCQATDPRFNNANSVLRGLVYVLLKERPALHSRLREWSDHRAYEDNNACQALSRMLTASIQDSNHHTYLIVDASDECVEDQRLLLELIMRTSTDCPGVKWIISSRNWPAIEQGSSEVTRELRLSLELNSQAISAAVANYIEIKTNMLAESNNYDNETKTTLRCHLLSNAGGTFLWVALACQQLSGLPGWSALQKLQTFPPGLETIYGRMMSLTERSPHAQVCMSVLAAMTVLSRPITLGELATLVDLPVASTDKSIVQIVEQCGSFLTVQKRTILFVHQSAKDFLRNNASFKLFPAGIEEVHYNILSHSMRSMKTLRHDILNLTEQHGEKAQSLRAEQIEIPQGDPLKALQYSCVNWAEHLEASVSVGPTKEIRGTDEVESFLRENYVHWLEALSLLGRIPLGVDAMLKLGRLLHGNDGETMLLQKNKESTSIKGLSRMASSLRLNDPHEELSTAVSLYSRLRDARRFLLQHQGVITDYPLQVYASALLFSPSGSITRKQFAIYQPNFVLGKPASEIAWSSRMMTLGYHCVGKDIYSVEWSRDGKWVATGSEDKTVQIWSSVTGECVSSLSSDGGRVYSVSWSPDSTWLATESQKTHQVWEATTGRCIYSCPTDKPDKGPSFAMVAWSPDGKSLATSGKNGCVRVWINVPTHTVKTLTSMSKQGWITSAEWSPDGQLIAVGSTDATVEIWHVESSECLSRFSCSSLSKGRKRLARFISGMASDGGQPISCSGPQLNWSCDGTTLSAFHSSPVVDVWDKRTGLWSKGAQIFCPNVSAMAWSQDCARLAIGTDQGSIIILDWPTGKRLVTLKEGIFPSVVSLAWSPDGTQLVSASTNEPPEIWDATSHECEPSPPSKDCWPTIRSYNGNRPEAFIPKPSSQGRAKNAPIESEGKSLDQTHIDQWNAASEQNHQESFSVFHLGIRSMCWSNDQSLLASAGCNGQVIVWDMSKQRKPIKYLSFSSRRLSMDWSVYGLLAIGSPEDNCIFVWNWKKKTQVAKFVSTCADEHGIGHSVSWSPDGFRLAAGTRDGRIKIWDLGTDRAQTLSGHEAPVRSVMWSSDGGELVSWSGPLLKHPSLSQSRLAQSHSGMFKVWDVETRTNDETKQGGHGEVGYYARKRARESPEYGVSLDGAWITRHGHRVILLPPVYRCSVECVLDKSISICSKAGQIFVMRFA